MTTFNSGNFDHGSYKSGDKLECKRDAFELFLAKKNKSFFQKFVESVAADRQQPFDPELDAAETMQEWLESKALKNRGLYVARLTSSRISQNIILPNNRIKIGFFDLIHRLDNYYETPHVPGLWISFTQSFFNFFMAQVKNKSWFGLHASVRDVLENWTIQEQALHALNDYLVNRHIFSWEICVIGFVLGNHP